MGLYVQIQRGTGTTTNYGPDDLDVVTNVVLEAGGPDTIGKATITLKDEGVGYDIRSKDYVKIFESSDGGTTLTNRHFIGFVETYEQELVKGTNLVWWTLNCQDANILLDWLRVHDLASGFVFQQGASTRLGSHLGVDGQIERICEYATRNGTASDATFEATAGNELASSQLFGNFAFQFVGVTLRHMVADRIDAMIRVNGPTPPNAQFHMGYTTSGAASAFRPQLNIYDASARFTTGKTAPAYVFSTAPSGSDKAVRSVRRSVLSGELETSLQVKLTDDSVVTVARSTSANTATYPNQFDQRTGVPLTPGTALQAWEGPVRTITDNNSGGTTAQLLADVEIDAHENPAESIEIVSDASLASGLTVGQVVRIIAAEIGLVTDESEPSVTTVTKVVAAINTHWEPRATGGWAMVRSITLGNRLPELDALDVLQGSQRIAEGDNTAPEAPTGITATFDFSVPGICNIDVDGTESTSLDASYYRYYFTVGTQQQNPVNGPPGTPPVLPYRYGIFQGQPGSVYVTTIDTSGNESPPSNTFTWVEADTTPEVAEPTGVDKTLINVGTGYTAKVELTAPSPEPDGDYRYRYYLNWSVGIDADGQVIGEGVAADPPATIFTFRDAPIPYNSSGSIYVTTIDSNGNESAPSTPTTWTTADTTRVPSPTIPNIDFQLPSLFDPTQPEGWTIDADPTMSGELDTARVYEGTTSLKFTVGTTVNDTVTYTSERALLLDPAAGGPTQLHVRAVINPDLANGTVDISTFWRDSAGAGVGSPTLWYTSGTDPYLADTPNLVDKVITIPSGTAMQEIRIVVTSDGNANTVWVSGLEVEEAIHKSRLATHATAGTYAYPTSVVVDRSGLVTSVVAGSAVPDATTTVKGIVQLSTHDETTASEVVQANDPRIKLPYYNKTGANTLFAAMADGNPIIPALLGQGTTAASITGTNVGTTVARAVAFKLPRALSVGHVYAYTQGATTGIFTFAIYPRAVGSSKLWSPSAAFNTSAAAWLDVTSNTPFSIAADTEYWFCVAATAADSAAVFRTPGAPLSAAQWGTIAAPTPLNNLNIGIAEFVEFAVTAGSWPATLPSLSPAATAALWTGSVPYAYLSGTAS